jgi:hypothetical protein
MRLYCDNTQSNVQVLRVRRVCYTRSQHATSQLPRPRLSVPAILGHAYVPCGGIGGALALLMCSPWRLSLRRVAALLKERGQLLQRHERAGEH